MRCIGIAISAEDIKAGVIDENGNIYAKRIFPHRAEDYSVMCSDVKKLTERVLRSAGLALEDISGIGIASPGWVDSGGKVTSSFNTSWNEADMKGDFAKLFKKNVEVCNDAICGAMGEWLFGSGKGCTDALYMDIGVGVACGIICNNAPLIREGIAPSHFIVNPSGRHCSCGNYGCLETCINTQFIIDRTKEVMIINPSSAMWTVSFNDINNVTFNTAFDCAMLGDLSATNITEEFTDYLSIGLAGFINIFRPEKILIGGKLAYSIKQLLPEIERKVLSKVYGKAMNCTISLAVLGDDCIFMGAGALLL